MLIKNKMEKIEYALNPVENSNQDNVLLTICESSEGSQDLVTPANNEDVQYEVHSADGLFQYRLLNSTTENNNSNINIQTIGTQNPMQSANCQFYVINEFATNRPCLITPKDSEQNSSLNRHVIVGTSKKRDDKRRATHNEVERRRRDKINQWIFKLKDMLPDNSVETKSKTTGNESKGCILIKACEYIRELQDENHSLKECLKTNTKLTTENETLKVENEKLRKETERLTLLLEQKDVKLEDNFEYNS